MYTIDFEPVGRRGQFNGDQSLLHIARQLSVDLVSICGGIGSCEHCKVQVIAGEVSKVTLEEEASLTPKELEQGYRMACMTYPLSDVKLHVPPESLTAPQRTQVEGLDVDVEPDPAVRGLEAQADVQNLWASLAIYEVQNGSVDFRVSQTLSQVIRENNWHINVALRGNEIVAVGSPATRWLGLAVDIGTTKVAGYLVDLETGKTLASKGVMNPQISYGEDVVSRIVAASKSPADSAKLQSVLVDALSQMAAELCGENDAKP